jgi:DNA invertase Pin-like site-specific DNA recombinase
MATFGYARISTAGQTLEIQREALMAAGVNRVFEETASGARTDRPELLKLLKVLRPGDQLLVTRLDRMARSARQLLDILAEIGERGASFRSLGDPWADTGSAHGRLMVTVLSGLAEFERELIRVRTSEGRRQARERGIRMGRPPKLTPYQRREALARIAQGEETMAEIARSFNVARTTIARLKP